jgi:hypothetical protein
VCYFRVLVVSGACLAVAPRVTFTPTINGKPAVLRKDGHVPSYRVRLCD